MMVALAIIGILVALSVVAMDGVGRRSAAQNASHDLGAILSKARATAVAHGSDVWVIIYPQLGRSGSEAGPGAYYLYEDPDLTFNTGGGVAGELKYSAFSRDTSKPTGGRARLLDTVFLEDYSGDAVEFGEPPSGVTFSAPFASLNSGGTSKMCSFCSGGGSTGRGAVVFDANGGARFYNATGSQVVSRVAALTLINPTDTLRQRYLFGIAAGTGYVEVQRP